MVVAAMVDRTGNPSEVGDAVLFVRHHGQLSKDVLAISSVGLEPLVGLEAGPIRIEVDKWRAVVVGAHQVASLNELLTYLAPDTPPSTTRPDAMTNFDSSEARYSAAHATSSGLPSSLVS